MELSYGPLENFMGEIREHHVLMALDNMGSIIDEMLHFPLPHMAYVSGTATRLWCLNPWTALDSFE